MRQVLIVAVLLFLQGCQSLAYTFESDCRREYVPEDNIVESGAAKALAGAPVIVTKKIDAEQKLVDMFQRELINAWGHGYEVIGSCSITGDADQLDYMSVHASKVGADVVLRLYRYLDTFTESSDGAIYSYRVYEQWGAFFRKAEKKREEKLRGMFHASTYGIGVWLSDIDEKQSQRLKRNTGAYVVGVVRLGPAFNAGIVPGDVIVSFEGEAIISPLDLIRVKRWASLKQGEKVRVKVLRNSEIIEKELAIEPYSAEPFPESRT